jgi:signal recognition particle GTPase
VVAEREIADSAAENFPESGGGSHNPASKAFVVEPNPVILSPLGDFYEIRTLTDDCGLIMGLFDKLKRGLEKTKQILRTDVRDLFRSGQILDDRLLQDFEARMIRTDMGVAAAGRIVARIKNDHGGRTIDVDAVWKTIHDEMVELLKGHDSIRWDLTNPLSPLAKSESGPTVILVAGVNGAGKTTSIAKLANLLTEEWQQGGAGCRRHVSRGGCRTVDDVERTSGLHNRSQGKQFRSGGRRLRGGTESRRTWG